MTLEQTTLFGVRGERSRIRKSSPIAAVPGLRGDVVTDYSLAAEAGADLARKLARMGISVERREA